MELLIRYNPYTPEAEQVQRDYLSLLEERMEKLTEKLEEMEIDLRECSKAIETCDRAKTRGVLTELKAKLVLRQSETIAERDRIEQRLGIMYNRINKPQQT